MFTQLFTQLSIQLISQKKKMSDLEAMLKVPEVKHFTFDKIPDLTGKVAVVTGGNNGIGYITCRELAKKNAHVFILGRNVEKGQVAVEKIKSETGNQKVEFLKLDLKSLKSVKEFSFVTIRIGIQEEFGVNHVGHFLLTKLLLEKIKASQPARIVNLSSHAHRFATEGGILFDKLNDPSQEASSRYQQSKLANILFTNELNKRYLKGIQVYANSVHPGVVSTDMLNRNDLTIPDIFFEYSISPDDGAITTLYCATSPEIEEKNYRSKYFEPFGNESEKSTYAQDENLAKRLWEYTEDLINEKLPQK
ncbi:367_t:CDS:2 [Cetraspora pellucida]|uniref:367_t:CDS:1 n=1 Tax=Cetraspora pellucida TaxID=1433469 RepID=A0ACA9PGF3_9GLOM|nr:367_t:CDS:2 [Cetraspora pellucida]